MIIGAIIGLWWLMTATGARADEVLLCEIDDNCPAGYECRSESCPAGQRCLTVLPRKICQQVTAVDCPVYSLAEPETGCYYEGTGEAANGCPLPPKLVCENKCQEGMIEKEKGNVFNNQGACDNQIDLADFLEWRIEYLTLRLGGTVERLRADFNNDKTTDLADFLIWRDGYLSYGNGG